VRIAVLIVCASVVTRQPRMSIIHPTAARLILPRGHPMRKPGCVALALWAIVVIGTQLETCVDRVETSKSEEHVFGCDVKQVWRRVQGNSFGGRTRRTRLQAGAEKRRQNEHTTAVKHDDPPSLTRYSKIMVTNWPRTVHERMLWMLWMQRSMLPPWLGEMSLEPNPHSCSP